jgi:hypothetical protein
LREAGLVACAVNTMEFAGWAQVMVLPITRIAAPGVSPSVARMKLDH